MNYNVRRSKSTVINFIIYIAILIIFFMILGMDDATLNIDMKNENVVTLASVISLVMYFVAIVSSLHYYKLNKNKDKDMIFYLICFILSFLLHFANQTIWVNIQDENLLLNSFIVNKILILMTVTPNTKFKNEIIKKKVPFATCVILICFILSLIELSFFNVENIIQNNDIQILFLFSNIIYLYVSVIYLKRFKISKDYLYVLWTVFLLSRCVKNVSTVMYYSSNMENNKYATLALIIMYLGLIIYSTGLLFISNGNMKDKLKDKQDLDVFYNILDNQSKNIEMYFLNKDWKVIYANKTARRQYAIKENNMKSFEYLGDVCKNRFENFDQKYKLLIKESLKNSKSWRGVISKGCNNEMLLDIKTQVSKEYGEIYVAQIDYNKEMIKLKKEVEEKNKLFDVITEKSGDLIIIIDKKQRIKYANKKACNLLGYEEDEIIGLKLRNILVNNNKYNFKDERIFEELQFKCKDNKIIEVETLGTPINDEGWILISRNITYRKEMQLLKEENEKMKVYQQLKTDFFANLSHELKTPLNIFYSIIQILDLNLEKKEDNDFKLAYKKHSDGLKINFYRMLRMITNLIDLTKFDSNYKDAKFNNYDIVRLCEDVTLSVVTYAQQKNIEIIFDTYEEEHIIRCDAEHMERIMLNLLSNAIKYTPSGGEIFVNLSFDDNYVNITVKDNGIGIPKEKLDSIFEKFVRVDKTIKRENEGSGIGLNIVKSLVDLLEGNIHIESSENIGSEFTIEIPNIKLEEGLADYDVDKERITLELSDVY
ncbi:sensor histidine kinase [Terrisporobacter glycolicus]|uniref:histidine kinase n=1 Tax=Terrisporobacter glycolicus ATCC 14880 = DSM 1288 TaxID=1121315 RepID=A0ABZ2EW66_9FIRM|nr:PAS domain-containing sensor histidine kinase [Terrisporobacter glycolicus]